jgi:hypothetical protein
MGPNIIAGKDLERYWRHQDASLAFHNLFNERGTIDERAIAIVGHTFLDNILEHTLINFMVDDEKRSQEVDWYRRCDGDIFQSSNGNLLPGTNL